ncbi:Bacterial sugar transferase [Propionibacterium ruminifibrarum]|uniref:Bacterial sugar transferase n=1 Tax=Propionibacterium ruminifibrarum TaxID=1962131 RepID=A0A375I4D9_9ACTN|nr:Bacterial sugar transferase [Propionibacterium ruminifibrarum]
MSDPQSISHLVPAATTARVAALFQRSLIVGDLVVITATVSGARLVRLEHEENSLALGLTAPSWISAVFGVGVIITWWVLLGAVHSYSERILGSTSDEYYRVIQATVIEFGALALLSYLSGVQLPRSYFLAALPFGGVMLLVWRWLARRYFVRARRAGSFMRPTFIIGSWESASAAIAVISERPELGLQPCGAFLSDAPAPADGAPGDQAAPFPVPIVGGVKQLEDAIQNVEGITLMVAQESGLAPADIRRISWALGTTSRLIMVPSVIDVSGPRLHLRPLGGISLLEIQISSISRLRLVVKRLGDIVVSAIVIIVLIPMWIVVPLLIRHEDHGPVFFRQTRIGRNGHGFRIWKFRTMRVNADDELQALLSKQGAADKPLFKVDHDPRITRIGAVLRRTSLDEFPQLFNVLDGSMSLVGPRPQVPKEVELYDETAARRLLVKPGMTGLWQVNGRSSLTWEEALRFDLFYVENWTLSMDLMILLKTIKVVLTQEGSA